MSAQIDWSKAPEDATHYHAATHGVFECWLKPGHAVRVSRREPDWREDEYADDLIATSAIKRPWSGEGLPPVGTVLEAIDKEFKGGTWTKVVVLAVGKHGNDDCLMVAEVIEGQSRPGAMVASLYTGWERSFRPIRTHEQIAADEREAAIKEACAVVGCSVGSWYGEVVAKVVDHMHSKQPTKQDGE